MICVDSEGLAIDEVMEPLKSPDHIQCYRIAVRSR